MKRLVTIIMMTLYLMLSVYGSLFNIDTESTTLICCDGIAAYQLQLPVCKPVCTTCHLYGSVKLEIRTLECSDDRALIPTSSLIDPARKKILPAKIFIRPLDLILDHRDTPIYLICRSLRT